MAVLVGCGIAAACGADDGKRRVPGDGAGGAAGERDGANVAGARVGGASSDVTGPSAGAGGMPSSNGPEGGAGGGSGDSGGGPETEAGGGTAEGGAGGSGGDFVACSDASTPGIFHDSFTELSATHWNVLQSTADLYSATATGGAVVLSKPDGNPAGLQRVAIVLDLASVGAAGLADFDESIQFSDATLGTGGTYQVELHAYFEDSSYFFVVYDNSSGLNVHVWDGAIHAPQATAQTSGTFRIRREGANLSGYFDEKLVWSTTSTSPLSSAEFTLQVQPGATGPESVRFDDFELQGACVRPD